MTSDNVKAIIYTAVGLAGLYVGFKVYKSIKDMGASISAGVTGIPGIVSKALAETGNDIRDGAEKLKISVKESIRTAVPSGVSDAIDSVKETLGVSSNNPDFIAPAFVREISAKDASPHVKAFIRDTKRARGISVQNNNADFIGWRVFEDGTIISPVGEYFQMAYDAIKGDTPDNEWSVKPIYFEGATAWNFLSTREQWQDSTKNTPESYN